MDEKKKRDRLKEMEALKSDQDLMYLDGSFYAYIVHQTAHVKAQAERIEAVVKAFAAKTNGMPAGMIPTDKLIDSFSKVTNHLEKAHTQLAVELVRMKSMEILQKEMLEGSTVKAPETDVSVG